AHVLANLSRHCSCSVNSPYQTVNFVHVGIELESKASPVKFFERGGMLGEQSETGFLPEIHGTLLHVAVIQTAHPAKQIGELHQRNQSGMVDRFFRRVMKTHHLDEFRCEFPTLCEQTSTVTVRKTHALLLGLVQWNAARFGSLPGGTEFLGQDPKVDDDSQVVEQSGEIGFSGITKVDLGREMPADQRASQGVLPEDHRIQASFVAREHVQHAA